MTNVTLSINDGVYKRMKKYPEIKWSEFARQAIENRLNELDSISIKQESLFTMLASENVLKKEWDNSHDERWDHV